MRIFKHLITYVIACSLPAELILLQQIKDKMKAAVMYSEGLPKYIDLDDPTAQNSNEIVVSVKAVALKHFDKARAAGKHYSDEKSAEGKVPGGDGVCLLPDGKRVYGVGISGTLAEKAIIDKTRMVAIPEGLDDATAAALPNAVIGAAMGLRFKANMQPCDVVVINGATGFTGRIAVQIAKYYGAKRIIATGRNEQSLHDLLALGADDIILITGDYAHFKTQFAAIHTETPVDVIIDYLWGTTAQLLLAGLMGKGSFTHKTRFVSVGSMAGDAIQLTAANLRSVNLELTGSGLGAWPKEQLNLLFTEILPEMFLLAAHGKLSVETTTVTLKDIANVWALDVPGGQRLVVTM